MTDPLIPPEEARHLQKQIDELARQWDALKSLIASGRFTPVGAVVGPPEQGESVLPPTEAPPSSSTHPVTPRPDAPAVVPAWLNPILQGVTIVIVLGSVFWFGQTIGTINTKVDGLQRSVDSLQKSVDRLNDWKDVTTVSLASLNARVDSLNAKIDDIDAKLDDLSKTKK
jgi:prefoldin subunit 5